MRGLPDVDALARKQSMPTDSVRLASSGHPLQGLTASLNEGLTALTLQAASAHGAAHQPGSAVAGPQTLSATVVDSARAASRGFLNLMMKQPLKSNKLIIILNIFTVLQVR